MNLDLAGAESQPAHPMSSLQPTRVWSDPPGRAAIAGFFALILPVLVFGPWLPLLDLVAFVAMNSYPAQLSYGPFHYATFQFTYEGHYAVSRFLTDLRVSVPHQVVLLYLAQGLTCFFIVYRMLERMVQKRWLCAIGIAFGVLAFWSGVFLWGGPLAFSLAAVSLMVATSLSLREAADSNCRSRAAIATFIGFSLFCHPFALPFVLVLCFVRFCFMPKHRLYTGALAVGALICGYVILRDSPATEAAVSASLGQLFGVRPTEMIERVAGLFTDDSGLVRVLFGHTPITSVLWFWGLGLVHLCAFAVSPILAFRKREAVWLRMTASLCFICGLIYLFSRDKPEAPIPEWPQRVLAVYAPFTFVTGFYALGLLIGRLRPGFATADYRPTRYAWLVPAAVLLLGIATQAQVLRLGRSIGENYNRVRAEVLKSGVANAYVVVATIDNIRPFYLRCVPFLLFSDPEIISRNLVVATEWHFQERHPSRLVEGILDAGRKRYVAAFSMKESALSVALVEEPTTRFPVIEGTNRLRWGNTTALALAQFKLGVQLLNSGAAGAALEHFNTATYLEPKFANAWNNGGVALYQMGRRDDAIQYIENAIKEDPKLIEARTNLATILIASGRGGEAIPHLEEALRINPNLDSAKVLLDAAKQARATK